ncbi:MAG: hypothetical protein LBC39_07225 [Methanobrevibacter sp.]|jgi:hypothetical protein|nr:hypothetical protein [Candidatus Methanovirga aequatorialis]
MGITFNGADVNNYLSTVRLSNCNFTNNEIATNSGAIENWGSILTVENCNFNKSKTIGGAIDSYSIILTIAGSSFISCKASGLGGVINNFEPWSTSIGSTRLTGNTASNDGAVATNKEMKNIDICTFSNNRPNNAYKC